MAFTITKLGAGPIVRIVDASNDATVVNSELRAGLIFELDIGSAVYPIHKLFGSGAPGTDYSAAAIGSEYTNIANGEFYLKTGLPDTWTKQT